jgi:hypothetical protein
LGVLVLVLVVTSVQSTGPVQAKELGASLMPLESLALKEAQDVQAAAPGHGDKIKEKTEALADAVCDMDALVQSDDLGVFTAAQKQGMNDSCSRAQGLAEEPPPDDYYAMGKVRNPECAVAELMTDTIGNNDGICDTKGPDKEVCLEVNDDGIGDDDSICEKWHDKGKPIWEPCVQTCDLEAVEADDGNFNEVRLEAMEGALDEATGQVRSATAAVAARMEVLRSVRATASALAEGETGACKNLMFADLKDGNEYWERPHNYQEIHDLTVSGYVMGQVAAICENIAGTDVFGTNAYYVCTVPNIVDAVVSSLAQSYELLDDSITGTRLDNALVCLENLGDKLEGMDKKLDYLIYLLNLPQGQRPEFPKPPEVPEPTDDLQSMEVLTEPLTTDAPPGKSKP